ncbi:hypothetical protein ACIP68_22990 [Streptomyces griseoviridis]
MTAPTCHGRTMTRHGQQFVCDRCGAWTDPGTRLRREQHRDGDTSSTRVPRRYQQHNG